MPGINISMHLDRENPVYRPGEIISGQAMITLDKPLSIRQVKISFTGEACARWTVGAQGIKIDVESLFHKTTTVWPDNGPILKSSSVMSAGKYAFKFSFPIPEKTMTGFPLPSDFSFNDDYPTEYGYIRYLLHIYIVKPMREQKPGSGWFGQILFDQTHQQQVSIRGVYDLNTNPLASLPAAATDEMTINSLCCCASGRIDVSIKFPKTGYAIGEFLAILAEIANRSKRTIKQVRLELIQVCKFRTRTGYSKEVENSMIAGAAKDEPVLPGQTQNWENEGFLIPIFARTSGEACRIIEFSHHLVLEVVQNDSSKNLKVWLPVIIGNVPVVMTSVGDTTMAGSQMTKAPTCTEDETLAVTQTETEADETVVTTKKKKGQCKKSPFIPKKGLKKGLKKKGKRGKK